MPYHITNKRGETRRMSVLNHKIIKQRLSRPSLAQPVTNTAKQLSSTTVPAGPAGGYVLDELQQRNAAVRCIMSIYPDTTVMSTSGKAAA